MFVETVHNNDDAIGDCHRRGLGLQGAVQVKNLKLFSNHYHQIMLNFHQILPNNAQFPRNITQSFSIPTKHYQIILNSHQT